MANKYKNMNNKIKTLEHSFDICNKMCCVWRCFVTVLVVMCSPNACFRGGWCWEFMGSTTRPPSSKRMRWVGHVECMGNKLRTTYDSRVAMWLSLRSALSCARLKTTLADSHVFARRVASCSVLPVNHLTILSAARRLECTLIVTSLRLHGTTFAIQMKSW
jgi:hypothetical protein